MNCGNDYCIYNRSYECILDEINIDSTGRCDDCIIVRFDEKILAEEKRKQLIHLETKNR